MSGRNSAGQVPMQAVNPTRRYTDDTAGTFGAGFSARALIGSEHSCFLWASS
jgi:hypothetical protein